MGNKIKTIVLVATTIAISIAISNSYTTASIKRHLKHYRHLDEHNIESIIIQMVKPEARIYP